MGPVENRSSIRLLPTSIWEVKSILIVDSGTLISSLTKLRDILSSSASTTSGLWEREFLRLLAMIALSCPSVAESTHCGFTFQSTSMSVTCNKTPVDHYFLASMQMRTSVTFSFRSATKLIATLFPLSYRKWCACLHNQI